MAWQSRMTARRLPSSFMNRRSMDSAPARSAYRLARLPPACQGVSVRTSLECRSTTEGESRPVDMYRLAQDKSAIWACARTREFILSRGILQDSLGTQHDVNRSGMLAQARTAGGGQPFLLGFSRRILIFWEYQQQKMRKPR